MGNNSFRYRQIHDAVDHYKTPFNSNLGNSALEGVRNITIYCDKTECKDCLIKGLIFCNGKTSAGSPYNWCDVYPSHRKGWE